MRTLYIKKSTETEEPICFLEQNVNLPAMTENSIMIQIKACGLSMVNLEIFAQLNIKRERHPVGREISGSVTQVGAAVTNVKVGDDVVGVLPLDTECSGCADLCIINEYDVTHVIDLIGGKKNALLNSCLEETGGLGVDVIIDNGVSMHMYEDENITGSPAKSKKDKHLPSKHEIIMSLGVGGRWITSQNNLQLDPPDSQLLYFKGASVSFLFDSFWTLSSGQQGRYQHILKDIINKVANGTLRPNISQKLPLEKVPDMYRRLTYRTIGKFVMEN
uniref:Quinone oxidoreductase-like protein 1-like n=1 Tax=Saccoglossus kowalevskii TaxID=10224 RepID=A0ABM0LUP7_SACKO|nr:PREDICTED: quinone oxidoreductase-like protein 1-like [Saccoglossus kowalevskii]